MARAEAQQQAADAAAAFEPAGAPPGAGSAAAEAAAAKAAIAAYLCDPAFGVYVDQVDRLWYEVEAGLAPPAAPAL